MNNMNNNNFSMKTKKNLYNQNQIKNIILILNLKFSLAYFWYFSLNRSPTQNSTQNRNISLFGNTLRITTQHQKNTSQTL
jgi:hypothetical protein